VALSVAGSDSGGGAGIQADLKTFAALGVFGTTALTAVTAQNTRGVQGVWPLAPEAVRAQIEAVLADLPVRAAKTGMLGSAGVARTVAEAFGQRPELPLVVDPVLVATSGDALAEPDVVLALREHLAPCAELLTPNVAEAARLLDAGEDAVRADPAQACRGLLALGPRAVLLKGGHRDGPEAIDLLWDGRRLTELATARVDTPNLHGTGCSLAAAVVAWRARGLELTEAVRAAKAWLQRAIEAGAHWRLGGGSGPIRHDVPPTA